jgi:hypothetical protein
MRLHGSAEIVAAFYFRYYYLCFSIAIFEFQVFCSWLDLYVTTSNLCDLLAARVIHSFIYLKKKAHEGLQSDPFCIHNFVCYVYFSKSFFVFKLLSPLTFLIIFDHSSY